MDKNQLPVPESFSPDDLSFLDWVALQDPEREVNHYSWDTCAVGEYLQATRQESLWSGHDLFGHTSCAHYEASAPRLGFPESLHSAFLALTNSHEGPATYGELDAALKNLYGV